MFKVIFVPSVYIDALCLDSAPIRYHANTESLFKYLRDADKVEIGRYSEVLAKYINKGMMYPNSTKGSFISEQCSVIDDEYGYVKRVTEAIGECRNLPSRNVQEVTIEALADGTVIFLEQKPKKPVPYNVFEKMCVEVGKVLGVSEMMKHPNW